MIKSTVTLTNYIYSFFSTTKVFTLPPPLYILVTLHPSLRTTASAYLASLSTYSCRAFFSLSIFSCICLASSNKQYSTNILKGSNSTVQIYLKGQTVQICSRGLKPLRREFVSQNLNLIFSQNFCESRDQTLISLSNRRFFNIYFQFKF